MIHGELYDPNTGNMFVSVASPYVGLLRPMFVTMPDGSANKISGWGEPYMVPVEYTVTVPSCVYKCNVESRAFLRWPSCKRRMVADYRKWLKEQMAQMQVGLVDQFAAVCDQWWKDKGLQDDELYEQMWERWRDETIMVQMHLNILG